MMRGQSLFDAVQVDALFSEWAATARELPTLFDDRRAQPKIWRDKLNFDAEAAAFAKAVSDNRSNATQSVDGLKAAAVSVGQACESGHESYRLSRG